MKCILLDHGFWHRRLEVNARQAVFHQWEQLEASGCIDNFRLAAGEMEGFRRGWFFADSDAYKWLDAAARIWASHPDPQLGKLMDGFIALLGRAQQPDGYLYTYNQLHFPGKRWVCLQIEHELYCHGHLIEAGVSHFLATGRGDLLAIARRAADRIAEDFEGRDGLFTDGHEEIEIALLRLHQVVEGDTRYLELARQFIERRGQGRGFPFAILGQFLQTARRSRIVQRQQNAYQARHPEWKPRPLPPENAAQKPWHAAPRWIASALSGKYFQQHAPIRRQVIPVGHAVRFGYLQTAAAMLARLGGDRSLLPTAEHAWERLVLRRMYITGGVGSLPGLEGFGRDYELDPLYAYAETCAALACLFWNWEMTRLTGEAKYADLFEWQLYNAAAVGMGLDGRTYFYNNPLACRGGVERRPWYAIPCCPSNLSRTFASLGGYIYTVEQNRLTVHQYISSSVELEIPQAESKEKATLHLEMESDLPWEGKVRLRILEGIDPQAETFSPELRLRLPAWAGAMTVSLNGNAVIPPVIPQQEEGESTACGYDPRPARYVSLRHAWSAGDELEIGFDMPIVLRRAHPRVRGHQGKAAITRGPLVYCLEKAAGAPAENATIDIFHARIDPASLAPLYDESMPGGIVKIAGRTISGDPVTFIPYFVWGNRGPSQMTVWVNL